MKYILIIMYMATPVLGESETDADIPQMPRVHGAAVENLNHERVVVILGRFSSKTTCEGNASALVAQHLSNVDKQRAVKATVYGCYQDPQT